MLITHEQRFTDVEMANMFQVELDEFGTIDRSKCRVRHHEGGMAMNDTRLPLLVSRKRKTTQQRGFKKALQGADNIVQGVTVHPPGSKERLNDLIAFYHLGEGIEATPFDC